MIHANEQVCLVLNPSPLGWVSDIEGPRRRRNLGAHSIAHIRLYADAGASNFGSGDNSVSGTAGYFRFDNHVFAVLDY